MNTTSRIEPNAAPHVRDATEADLPVIQAGKKERKTSRVRHEGDARHAVFNDQASAGV
ncbi:hypothetical protein [Paraburkholderia sp.]|uniref:hypothetical protein n=1 Tax=Paraburkholderia sp. TaxID=1926495 RepID=UPI00257BDEEB|nr:hypothetical protein [Paraburkholderia sp.]